jgi:hypothetical protein
MEAHDCNFRPDLGMGCINSRCPGHRAMRTLAENLRIAAFGAAMFKAGDNFGFHMGEDSSQCTCQWTPGRGVPYQGFTRCEQDDATVDEFEDDTPLGCCPRNTWGDEFHDPGCSEAFDPYAVPGSNGCTCGHNGDCNCPFVESP